MAEARQLQYTANGNNMLMLHGGTPALLDARNGNVWGWVGNWHRAAAIAPSGKQLAVVMYSGSAVALFDIARSRVRAVGGPTPGIAQSLALTPDAALLAVGRTRDDTTFTRRRVLEFAGIRSEVKGTGGLPAQPEISVHLWDVARRTQLPALPGDFSLRPPERVTITPNGRHLAAGSVDGSVWIWDLQTRQQLLRRFITADARRVAAAFLVGNEIMPGTPKYPEGVADVACSPNGALVAILSTGGRVLLWETTAWQEQRRWQVGVAPSVWLRFSPDSRTLAVGGAGRVTLWDAASGLPQGTLGSLEDAASVCGDFAPDGKTLVTGTADRRLRIWELAALRESAPLTGHFDRVSGVAFAPDGRTLASCSWDRTIRLWNVATRQEVASLEGHADRVHAII